MSPEQLRSLVPRLPGTSGATTNVTLLDGSIAQIRPVLAGDHDLVRDLLSSMSPDSRYLRGCGILNIDWLADWSMDLDYHDRYGAVVTVAGGQRVVAHAAYVRISPRRAEVAFEVCDELQGHGLGTLLLNHLAQVARVNGIVELVAEVMPSNYKMLEVLHLSGFPIVKEITDGLTDVVLGL